jgi:poly-gamma-glutamate synthesis protein (capsule biosynthesis protein)
VRDATLFLCGDVMTGRGIDQIMRQPSDPGLFEPYVRSALRYVEIAEAVNGPIPRAVAPDYVWGDALAELDRVRPDARIINLETAITTSPDAWPGKGIHYRMHPGNAACLSAAAIDCCVLANNHVLDWGYRGLEETLDTLARTGIRCAGAGRNDQQAGAPAIIELPGARRALIFAYGMGSSGVPEEWAARKERAGVNLLRGLSAASADAITRHVEAVKRARDLVVVSIHWGGNWGYEIGRAEREFARRLIDQAGVDLVHGHSSHHPQAFEVYRDKLILYGCGDFLNDYEGIGGYASFRAELTFMYFPTLDDAGRLVSLRLAPMRICRFRVVRADEAEGNWLVKRMNREGQPFGTRLEPNASGTLSARWS